MSDLLALAVGKDNPEYPPPPFLIESVGRVGFAVWLKN